MNFRKISRRGGGGVISDPKNFVAVFGGGKNDEFSGKGGGGQRQFGSFPKIHRIC